VVLWIVTSCSPVGSYHASEECWQTASPLCGVTAQKTARDCWENRVFRVVRAIYQRNETNSMETICNCLALLTELVRHCKSSPCNVYVIAIWFEVCLWFFCPRIQPPTPCVGILTRASSLHDRTSGAAPEVSRSAPSGSSGCALLPFWFSALIFVGTSSQPCCFAPSVHDSAL
jgi:hypothetical protein